MSTFHASARRFCALALALFAGGFGVHGHAYASDGALINRYAPTISGTPQATVAAGQAYSYTPQASDPDAGRLRFIIVNKPAWASFDTATGRLSGRPVAAGTHSKIGITVTDGYFATWLPRFSITVVAPRSAQAPIASVQAPTISGSAPAMVLAGQAYAFQPTARDPAGLALRYTITNKPAWATFSTATGTLTGTPTAADVGTYGNVVITASNGTASSSLPPIAIAVQAVTLGSATLTWMPPTTRTDGTALTNLAGYRIRYGTAPGAYTTTLDLPNPGLTAAVIENLVPAAYYFVVAAYDATGVESLPSAVATKTILGNANLR